MSFGEKRLRYPFTLTSKWIKNYANQIKIKFLPQISDGCLHKFLYRHNFVLRKRTSVCQKLPTIYAKAVAKFICYVKQRRKLTNNFSGGIFAIDETAVSFDCPDNRCVKTKGAQEVSLVLKKLNVCKIC